ncbi:hypothetical protein C8J57DRAFT_1500798 [Mycena rebaudengoi]|nr:hypothetical protein C8J57DRAFT_1500798 [Mycena rebaudengoi]
MRSRWIGGLGSSPRAHGSASAVACTCDSSLKQSCKGVSLPPALPHATTVTPLRDSDNARPPPPHLKGAGAHARHHRARIGGVYTEN